MGNEGKSKSITDCGEFEDPEGGVLGAVMESSVMLLLRSEEPMAKANSGCVSRVVPMTFHKRGGFSPFLGLLDGMEHGRSSRSSERSEHDHRLHTQHKSEVVARPR
jgi:hypothetical protein